MGNLSYNLSLYVTGIGVEKGTEILKELEITYDLIKIMAYLYDRTSVFIFLDNWEMAPQVQNRKKASETSSLDSQESHQTPPLS